jgi:hypothetical protein
MVESEVSQEYDLSAKTIKMDIKKSMDYKDLITEKIIRSHLSVKEKRPIYEDEEVELVDDK